MSQDSFTFAIISAYQSAERADQSTPKLVEDIRALITTIDSLEIADIVVVSTDNPVVDQAARELGAVNRLEPTGSDSSASAVCARIIESEESTVDAEAWVLYLDSRLSDFDFAEVFRRAVTARSVNPDVRALRAIGIDVADSLYFFEAGAFLENKQLPVSGGIDFLAD